MPRWLDANPQLRARLERLGALSEQDRRTSGDRSGTAAGSELGGSPELNDHQAGARRERRAAAAAEKRSARRQQLSYVAQLRRVHERNERWRRRHRKRMEARRGPEQHPPPGYPRELWIDVQECLHDLTGRVIRHELSKLRPVWAAMVRRAALGEHGDGTCARDWTSERARNIAAFGIAECRLAMRTRRKGKHTHVVTGYTRGAWCALLQGSRSRPLHVNTLSCASGYIRALRDAGLLYRQQLPAGEVEPYERWVNRDGETFASNRYWLCNPNPYDGHLQSDVRKALLDLAIAASAKDFLIVTRRPRKAPLHVPSEPQAPPARPPD